MKAAVIFSSSASVTVIGAISLTKVLALMTLNGSMDGAAFEVFIEHFLVPRVLGRCSGCDRMAPSP